MITNTPYYQRYHDGIQSKLEEVLNGLNPVQQLFELEKMAMKIRRENSPEVYRSATRFSQKYPKQKEDSNDYKR